MRRGVIMARYINDIEVGASARDLTGMKFSRLTVTHLAGRKESRANKPLLWACDCECGKKALVVSIELTSGDTKSCGCYLEEYLEKSNQRFREEYQTHGLSGTKEHGAWKRIKSRVFNKNNQDYKVYSKVGMSDSFANDFTEFLRDIGKIPNEMRGRVSVDRIDNTKGYVEGNVRWATDAEQARNKGMYTNNKSGVTGVYNQQGKYWVANWYVAPKKQKSRYFSIERYGDELSFLMACEYRQHQIDLLNLAGSGYTENHGIAKECVHD